MGTAMAIIENGSELGVITAATMAIASIAHLRQADNLAGVRIPASSKEMSTTGNSKVSPKATIINTTKFKYLVGL